MLLEHLKVMWGKPIKQLLSTTRYSCCSVRLLCNLKVSCNAKLSNIQCPTTKFHFEGFFGLRYLTNDQTKVKSSSDQKMTHMSSSFALKVLRRIILLHWSKVQLNLYEEKCIVFTINYSRPLFLQWSILTAK